MSAETAIGIVSIGAIVGMVVAYLLTAAVCGIWPFRADPPIVAKHYCPVCGDWLEEGEEACRPWNPEDDEPLNDEESHFLSVQDVDQRHGDDGNSGHG